MAIESVEFATSDGTKYKVTQLPAQKAQALLVRVMKVVGPSLARVADNAIVNGDDISGYGVGIETFFSLLNESLIEEINKLNMDKCLFQEADGEEKWVPLKNPNFESHFAGKPLRWMEWVWGCMKANYADFFGERAQSTIEGLRAQMKGAVTASSSQSTSKPNSTE